MSKVHNSHYGLVSIKLCLSWLWLDVLHGAMIHSSWEICVRLTWAWSQGVFVLRCTFISPNRKWMLGVRQSSCCFQVTAVSSSSSVVHKAWPPCQGGDLLSRSGAPPDKEPIHTFADLLCLSIYLLGWTLSPAGTTDVQEKQGGQKSSLSRFEWYERKKQAQVEGKSCPYRPCLSLWHTCTQVPKFFSDWHLITNVYSNLGCAYHGCKKKKVAMFDPLFPALRH